jgi:hypothetical protein
MGRDGIHPAKHGHAPGDWCFSPVAPGERAVTIAASSRVDDASASPPCASLRFPRLDLPGFPNGYAARRSKAVEQGDAEASSQESAKEIVAANRLDADVRQTPVT